MEVKVNLENKTDLLPKVRAVKSTRGLFRGLGSENPPKDATAAAADLTTESWLLQTTFEI